MYTYPPSHSLTSALNGATTSTNPRLNLNLNPHALSTKTRHPNFGPDRSMIRTAPLLEVLHHGSSRLLINRNVIASNAINLLPPLATGSLQRELDIGESLGDFGVEAGGDGDIVCVWVPTP